MTTTPLDDLTDLAERFQAIAKRTPPKYRQEIQTIADLLDTAADFGHSHLAQRILGRTYADLGVDAPAQTPAEPTVIYHDIRRWSSASSGEIVEYIRQHPAGVTRYEVAQRFGMRPGTAHGRLSALRRRGVIVTHKIPSPSRGRSMLGYRLAGTPEPTPAQIDMQAAALAHVEPEPLPPLARDTASAPPVSIDVRQIYSILADSPASAQEVADRLGAGKSVVYKRLAALVERGRVTVRSRPGTKTLVYSLPKEVAA